jgi:cell division protease FtsH
MQPRTAKLDLFILLLLAIGVAIEAWNFSTRFETPSKVVAFRDFMRDVDAGQIEQVTITGQKVSGIYRADNATFHTYAPAQSEGWSNKLDAQGIPIKR